MGSEMCIRDSHWLDEGQQIADDELRKLLSHRAPGSDQIDAAIERFRDLLQHSNLKKLLSSSTVKEQYVVPDLDAAGGSDAANRIEVHTEKRLAVLMDQLDYVDSDSGSLIEGIVDRLVLIYEGGCAVAAEIIDFKVDQIDDSNLTERIEHYRPQLSAYRSAVKTMLGLGEDRIATRLVFVQTGQVVQVDSLDMTIDGDTNLDLPRKKPTSKAKESKAKTATAKTATAKTPKVKAPKASSKPAQKEASETQQTFWSDEG